MTESFLFYSSLTLFTMGCLSLCFFIIFRSKFHALKDLPKNLSANVFNKTFIVFNPYPEQRKLIHSFLSVLPMIIGFASLGLALALLLIFEAGLMLTFFITIIGLSLIVLEDAPEIYQNSKVFIDAVQRETNLGTGDLKVFHIVKTLTPKVSNYYLGLSVGFLAFSATLSYIWSSALWVLAQFMRLIFQVSESVGVAAWMLPIFLFALTIVIIQIFASRIKRKILGHVTESPILPEQYYCRSPRLRRTR